MLVVILIGIGLLALAAVVLIGLRSWVFEQGRVEEELLRPGHPTLVYAVPVGQDPAVLAAALRHEGFTSAEDFHGGHEMLLVDCPGGTDAARERVRSVIEHVTTTAIADGATLAVGRVRFEDET